MEPKLVKYAHTFHDETKNFKGTVTEQEILLNDNRLDGPCIGLPTP
jgi:hypothetical protein